MCKRFGIFERLHRSDNVRVRVSKSLTNWFVDVVINIFFFPLNLKLSSENPVESERLQWLHTRRTIEHVITVPNALRQLSRWRALEYTQSISSKTHVLLYESVTYTLTQWSATGGPQVACGLHTFFYRVRVKFQKLGKFHWVSYQLFVSSGPLILFNLWMWPKGLKRLPTTTITYNHNNALLHTLCIFAPSPRTVRASFLTIVSKGAWWLSLGSNNTLFLKYYACTPSFNCGRISVSATICYEHITASVLST